MIVILLFNELEVGASLSLNTIEEKTKLPTWVLSKILIILSRVPETQILIMKPRITDVESSDEYFFNESFESKTKVVTIPVTFISSWLGQKDEIRKYSESQSRFDTERLQACIVRVMKSEREMTHARLLSHVMQVYPTGSKPEFSMIKKGIDALINREYIERIEERPAYKYIV